MTGSASSALDVPVEGRQAVRLFFLLLFLLGVAVQLMGTTADDGKRLSCAGRSIGRAAALKGIGVRGKGCGRFGLRTIDGGFMA